MSDSDLSTCSQCCSGSKIKISKSLVLLLVQIVALISVMAFCLTRIGLRGDEINDAERVTLFSLLSTCIGILVPSPLTVKK